MPYQLGIDLGTTYTAAAVAREGRAEMVTLGNRAATIPSAVFLREDGTILTGDAAKRRGVLEPERLAQEFKRRVGDTTPLLLGGMPYSAESVMAKLLRWVVDQVAEREGEPHEVVALTHPANWGPYKRELLDQAIRMAGLTGAVTLTEPEAAAIYYATQERIEPGTTVAVYDLGGGTFDAVVLRKRAETGFEVLGAPEGIERLGGIDVDEAVFFKVTGGLGGAMADLDASDATTVAALARLRDDSVEAKEALSSDTDTAIPVMLPGLQTEVRITRAELERLIRPTLAGTIDALHRAIRSAQLAPAEIDRVLLVGGSSRIPLVAELVAEEFGRPVAVDAHPKHAVALGAALTAAETARTRPVTPVAVTSEPPPPPPPEPKPPEAVPAPEPVAAGRGRGRARRRLAMAGLVTAGAAAIIAGAVLFGGGGDGNGDSVEAAGTETETTTTVDDATTTEPRPAQFVEINDIEIQNGIYVISFEVAGFTPVANFPAGSFHSHFFWDSEDRNTAGRNGIPAPGVWMAHDKLTPVNDPTFSVASRPDGANQICVLVATHEHNIADIDGDGEFDSNTGNCFPVPPG